MRNRSHEVIVDSAHLTLLSHVHGDEKRSGMGLRDPFPERLEVVIVIEALRNTDKLDDIAILSRSLEMR